MIYEILPTGREHGVTNEFLMIACGIDDKRVLRQQIREERLDGKPILNRGNKYFRSDDPDDYDAWLRTTFRKGTETLNAAKAVLRKRPTDDRQMSLEDYLAPVRKGAADVQKEILHSEEV